MSAGKRAASGAGGRGAWPDRLRAEVPREQIPAFLADLQRLVAALREGRQWHALVTARLQAHPDLVLDYLDPGPKRDAVAAVLRDG